MASSFERKVIQNERNEKKAKEEERAGKAGERHVSQLEKPHRLYHESILASVLLKFSFSLA